MNRYINGYTLAILYKSRKLPRQFRTGVAHNAQQRRACMHAKTTGRPCSYSPWPVLLYLSARTRMCQCSGKQLRACDDRTGRGTSKMCCIFCGFLPDFLLARNDELTMTTSKPRPPASQEYYTPMHRLGQRPCNSFGLLVHACSMPSIDNLVSCFIFVTMF
jgi:hypothetical protein